jgi:RNA polymerase subunit RPABC4/transcription elongation factor Spt4
MVAVICAVCGEVKQAKNESCPACDAHEVRAVPEDRLRRRPKSA